MLTWITVPAAVAAAAGVWLDRGSPTGGPIGLTAALAAGFLPMGLFVLYRVPGHLVGRLMAGLPSGSYLVVSDSTATSEGMIAASKAYNASGAVPYYVRSVGEIAAFFDGLDLVDPGVVQVPEWRPDLRGPDAPAAAAADAYCGVGRKS